MFPSSADRAPRMLVWMAVSLFLAYLTVAMSLPVMSLHVTRHFGYGNVLAGLAAGLPFVSTLLTRGHAGTLSDYRGGKRAVLLGLAWYVGAGAVCLMSVTPGLPAAGAFALLLAGRVLLGIGESLALVGLISWAIALMGPARSGRVLALVGMALYGAFAVGGPLGLAVYQALGFAGLMGLCLATPLLGMAMLARLPGSTQCRGSANRSCA